MKINSDSGDNFIFYLAIENSSEKITSDVKYVPSIKEINLFLEDMSSQNENLIYSVLENALTKNTIGISVPLYEMLDDLGRKNVVTQVAANNYSSVSEVENFINQTSIEDCLIYIRDSQDIDKILFVDTYEELKDFATTIKDKNWVNDYKNNNKEINEVLEKLTVDERKKIYDKVVLSDIASIDDFYNSLSINVINYELDNVTGYGDVSAILKKYSSTTLKDMKYSSYLSCKYKNQINEDILGKEYKTIEELVDFINTSITTYNKNEQNGGFSKPNFGGSSSSSGGSSGGNGSSAGFGVTNIPVGKDPETPSVPTFKDLVGYDWAKDAIDNLYKKGVVVGTGNDEFQPQREVTREEFIKMLLLTLKYEIEDGDSNFDDVSDNAWYSSYIYSATKNGLIKGISDKKFGIGLPITREDVAVLIWRSCQGENVSESKFSDDGEVSSYAKNAVNWLKEKGIVVGYEDGSFRPKNLISRAEAAKILWNLSEMTSLNYKNM